MDLWSFYFKSLLVIFYSGQATAYINKILENDSVCSMSFISTTLNLLGREDQSAMVIKDSRYFQQWSGKHEFNCRFTVTNSLRLGIFAVIQHMYFRRNAQGQCIDYVQFRHTERPLTIGDLNFKFKTSEQWGKKICGKVNENEVDVGDDELENNNYESDDKPVPNSFIDNRGNIEVKLHLGNKSLDANEELSFEIVFTAFQECNFDNGLWKSCGSRTCIFREFFHDGVMNCPYKSCKDENGCNSVVTLSGDRLNTTFGTKIMAGTVAGLFTMFVAFIAFLWLFRHCGTVFCCIGNHNGHPHSSEMQPVPHLDTMAVMASAPLDSVVTNGAGIRTADKDLPPSYESLFPSK